MEITFSLTGVEQFLLLWSAGEYKGLRLGQAFYQHFECQKINSEKVFFDRLYELDGHDAKKMIESITDCAH